MNRVGIDVEDAIERGGPMTDATAPTTVASSVTGVDPVADVPVADAPVADVPEGAVVFELYELEVWYGEYCAVRGGVGPFRSAAARSPRSSVRPAAARPACCARSTG